VGGVRTFLIPSLPPACGYESGAPEQFHDFFFPVIFSGWLAVLT
jgi:hypothetical protein